MVNLEDTLSINHNWLNGYNIHWSWALLQQEYKDAAAAIEDCRSDLLAFFSSSTACWLACTAVGQCTLQKINGWQNTQ